VDEGKQAFYVSRGPRCFHGYYCFTLSNHSKTMVSHRNAGLQRGGNPRGAKGSFRRIKPTRMATGDLEYALPFSYPRSCDPHCRRSLWEQWQESSFVATLNFTWFQIFDAWKAGRHLVRLQSVLPEFYRCPRCHYRYPHVSGYHWTRQSYFGLAGCGTAKGVSACDQQVCKCYSIPSGLACRDHDEPTRATRRFWREASAYPRA